MSYTDKVPACKDFIFHWMRQTVTKNGYSSDGDKCHDVNNRIRGWSDRNPFSGGMVREGLSDEVRFGALLNDVQVEAMHTFGRRIF